MIADKMHFATTNEIFERLTVHRLSIRSVFESIVGVD